LPKLIKTNFHAEAHLIPDKVGLAKEPFLRKESSIAREASNVATIILEGFGISDIEGAWHGYL
jgi:hypothetical protein